MREQTRRNIQYIVALDVMSRISVTLGWSEEQFEAARGELIRSFNPTLVEV
jgi:hypothetical protein